MTGAQSDTIRDQARRHSAETIDLVRFAGLAGAMAFITALIYHFSLESKAFFSVASASLGGFAVHYFLPLRYRLGFFILLSLGTIVLLLGAGPGAWLVGIGLLLIGLSRLPVRFGVRVALVLSAGAALMTMRGGWLSGPVPAPVWPILGSIFMFRLVVYMYDLKHDPALATPGRTLAYFFLLPNVCFPLFPVIDFKTFCRQYYDADRHQIYLKGVEWIFRGVVQLILYRLVYHTMVIEPAAVVTIADLGQYLLWPYLLYLRVSGQFHVVVGILHLFGFNLPETHRSYFLASSFTDFWRRINIYWKDFMMKVFYYPAFFALRKRGQVTALVLATLLVFAVTWALHSYQTFWIQGHFLLAWNDVMFWSVLAVLVLANSLHEWRRGRQRRLTDRALSWGATLRTAASTVAMFCTICVLWSLWSTESLAAWFSLWSAAGVAPAPGQWGIAALVVAMPAAVGLAAVAASRAWRLPLLPGSYLGRTAIIAGVATALVLLSTSRVYRHLGSLSPVIASVRFGGLNQADHADMERGYYENLMGVDRFNGELWALYMNRPADWERGLHEAGLSRETGGFPPFELLPSTTGRFKGAPLATNRWGLADKDYAQIPPAGCRRMAVLGASHAMGSGVSREETFEAVLESRLNRENPQRCHEIINFAVYGYNPLFQLAVLDKAATFRPEAVLYVAHPDDANRVVRFVMQSLRERRPLPYPALAGVAREAGVDATMTEREIVQRLSPHGERILSWLYAELVGRCHRMGIAPGYVLLPMVPQMRYVNDPQRQVALARQAGFAVADLSTVYAGSDRNALWVAEWDAHPNAAGHRLVADRLHAFVEQHRQALLPDEPRPPVAR